MSFPCSQPGPRLIRPPTLSSPNAFTCPASPSFFPVNSQQLPPCSPLIFCFLGLPNCLFSSSWSPNVPMAILASLCYQTLTSSPSPPIALLLTQLLPPLSCTSPLSCPSSGETHLPSSCTGGSEGALTSHIIKFYRCGIQEF